MKRGLQSARIGIAELTERGLSGLRLSEVTLFGAGCQKHRFNRVLVFPAPGIEIRSLESSREINLDGDVDIDTGPGLDLQPAVPISIAGQNEHDRPVATAKDPNEGRFVDRTGLGRIARMSVDPDPGELLG